MLFEVKKVIKKGDYLYALVPNHPNATKNGYVLMHRVVMENHLGRLLEKNEIVHHKDHNKLNNNIENLQVMDRVEHNRMHGSTGRNIIELVCFAVAKHSSKKKGLYTVSKHSVVVHAMVSTSKNETGNPRFSNSPPAVQSWKYSSRDYPWAVLAMRW